MKTELLNIIRCPKCWSTLRIVEQVYDGMEIVDGLLKCENCNSNYKIENGMPILYIEDQGWKCKALEAKGWVDYHKALGIYDQTGVGIDFVLPYFEEEPWIKVSKMFDICLHILNLNGSERILDLGAARGWAAKNFALKMCNVVAIDIVPDNQIGLGRAKAIMKVANTYFERVIGDNENLPFGENVFDIVFCAAVLHHTTNLEKILKNIYRVLSENGKLIAINEPCIGMLENDFDILKNSEELQYNINETRPNMVQYYNSLWKAGFRKIDLFPYQIYEQTNSDLEIWSKELGINDDDIDNHLYNISNNIPKGYLRNIKSSRRNVLKNTIMAKMSTEIIIYAEKVKKTRLAFVVQRYGNEVNGGAELLCRKIAEHLSVHYDIEIITTCAKDYITWKNEYPSGEDNVNGIVVRRFPVDSPRDINKFDKLSERIIGNKHSIDEELEWMKLQGPYSTQLLDFIKNNKEYYKFFIFFTYLYCTTFFGLPLVKDKAVLVPTAHDEPPIYLSIFDSTFHIPQAIIYSTEEEKKFVSSKFNNENILHNIIGVGIDVPEEIDVDNFKQKYNADNFVIYVGRIDESKGCKELFEYFIRYKKDTRSNIKLVLLGKPVMDIPKYSDIMPLGFVSEQDKFNGIKAAKLLIMPSKYESLSIAIMEAWLCDNAVLVNGRCSVLKGHCIKSNGGIYYENYEEFKECLNLLLDNSQLRIRMGENGKRYVEENYGWDIVERKYLQLLEVLK